MRGSDSNTIHICYQTKEVVSNEDNALVAYPNAPIITLSDEEYESSGYVRHSEQVQDYLLQRDFDVGDTVVMHVTRASGDTECYTVCIVGRHKYEVSLGGREFPCFKILPVPELTTLPFIEA